MSDHTHSCSGAVVDANPAGAGPAVAMCVFHLIGGIAFALVGGLVAALLAVAA